ncbi:MAG: DUF402 domain-containing protein [Thermomicrobiales bacterium]
MIGPRSGLVIPATLVDTMSSYLACFVPSGTPMLRLLPSPDASLPRVLSPHQIEAPDLSLVSQTWTGKNVLIMIPMGGHYAIHARWRSDWTFLGWYVNLQKPIVVRPDRWITEDQFLDIVVQPDRAWAWKDEDELAEAVRIGRLPADEAALLTAVGESLIPRIERAEWPFSPAIASWRPDPSWRTPAIPAGWEPTRR